MYISLKNIFMGKIKVLVVPSDRTGVSYFRSTIPHIKLEEYYPNDFYVDIDYEPNLDDDDYLAHIMHSNHQNLMFHLKK